MDFEKSNPNPIRCHPYIYSMYSCTISGMSREMMKMDGRGSAEYQFW